MEEKIYEVRMDGNVIASEMPLEVALTLIGAMFEKYYARNSNDRNNHSA